jgi:transposase-like protein
VAGEIGCPRCGGTHCTRDGSSRGHRRWRCRECGRTFAETVGTPLFGLRTPLPEIVRAILVVLRRGSLRAAEEQTGHNYETIAAWIQRLGHHADVVTQLLVRDLQLSEIEIDEFWSFVGAKGGAPSQRGNPIRARPMTKVSDGAA